MEACATTAFPTNKLNWWLCHGSHGTTICSRCSSVGDYARSHPRSTWRMDENCGDMARRTSQCGNCDMVCWPARPSAESMLASPQLASHVPIRNVGAQHPHPMAWSNPCRRTTGDCFSTTSTSPASGHCCGPCHCHPTSTTWNGDKSDHCLWQHGQSAWTHMATCAHYMGTYLPGAVHPQLRAHLSLFDGRCGQTMRWMVWSVQTHPWTTSTRSRWLWHRSITIWKTTCSTSAACCHDPDTGQP